MIFDIVDHLGTWTWLVVGLVLLALEIAVPGNVLVWLAMAAILTGALALFTDLGWQVDLIVFVVLAMALVVVGRSVFSGRQAPTADPLLNDRAARLIGKTFVLGEPIVDGHGRIRVDDANWRVVGPDLPSGTRVTVVGHDSAVLTVAPAAA